MTQLLLKRKTKKSTISYRMGDTHVETHSKTLNRTFRTRVTSERGRYLLSLLGRNTGVNKGRTATYRTGSNTFQFTFGNSFITRVDNVGGRTIRNNLTTEHALDLLSTTLQRGSA